MEIPTSLTTRLSLVLLAAGAICFVLVPAVPQQAPGFQPILEIEKPIFASNESVRFWIGVRSDVPIPEELRDSCVVHFLWPDGSTVHQRASWPYDGDPSRGWRGGWGFGTQTPAIGRYVVSFEFAGRKTADQTFEIVPDPFQTGIQAAWVFADSGLGMPPRVVALHVENRTNRFVRFAKPGLTDSYVFISVKQSSPPSWSQTFVPETALLTSDEIPEFSFEKLNWSNQSRWPMITVPPGGFVDRPLALQSAYPFTPGAEYQVTISNVLTIFVGEARDIDAQLFPMRVPISATTQFRW